MEFIKKAIKKLYPELDTGLHLPVHARVKRIADPPTEGAVSDAFRPYYAADVQILTEKGEIDTSKPIYESVPINVPMAWEHQGLFGFVREGTIVVVNFAYGSPEHPYISAILPTGLQLPELKENELLLQKDPRNYIKTDHKNNWRIIAENKLNIGNGIINLLAEVRALAAQVKNHTHTCPDGITSKPNQHESFATIESNIDKITE